MKRTRWRSSGTRQAFASQENIAGARSRVRFCRADPEGVRFAAAVRSPPASSVSRPRPRVLRSPASPRPPARRRPARLVLLLLALDRLAEARDGAARSLDLLDRRLRERVRGDGELLRELALAEDLHVDGELRDEAGGLQRVRRDLGAGVEALLEAADVHGLRVRAERPDRHRVRGRVAAELARRACRSASGRPRSPRASCSSRRGTSGP